MRYDKLQEVVSAHETDTKRRLDDLAPVLESTSARLRSACQTVLKESSGWLKWTNARRWKRGEKAIYPTSVQVRQEQLAELNAALAEYRTKGHMRMLEPFRDLFHPETGDFITEGQDVPEKYMISTRSIFRCFVFSSNMISYAGCVHELGQLMINVDQKAPKSKLQFPTAIVRVALKVAGSKQGGGNPLDMGIPDPDRESENDDESTAVPEEQKLVKHSKFILTWRTSLCRRSGRRCSNKLAAEVGSSSRCCRPLFSVTQWSFCLQVWLGFHRSLDSPSCPQLSLVHVRRLSF